MEVVLLVARMALAAVFVVSGIAKLVDRAGSRRAFVEFGLPAGFVRLLAVGLPVAELLLAVGLVLATTARPAAVAALALLALFTAAIVVTLARGQRPDCHCFGQLSSEPIGAGTIARNIMLAIPAGLVAWLGGGMSVASLFALPEFVQGAGFVLQAVTLLLLALGGGLIYHLMRQNGRLLLRIEALEARLEMGEGMPEREQVGLGVGAAAPDFRLPGMHGQMVTLDELRAAGRLVLLVFIDPGCSPCAELLPALLDWRREYARKLTITAVSRGTREANQTRFDALAGQNGAGLLLQNDFEVADSYGVKRTPSAVAIDPNGSVASRTAEGTEEIADLVDNAVRLFGDMEYPSGVNEVSVAQQ